MAGHAQLKFVITECSKTQIRLTRPNLQRSHTCTCNIQDIVFYRSSCSSVNDTDFWIGAKDTHNTSIFYWPNGHQLTYTHWYTIVPPPPHTCVILEHVGNYKWQTVQCDKPKTGYICEVNKHTVGKISTRRFLDILSIRI